VSSSVGTIRRGSAASIGAVMRTYLASDVRRGVQTALGLIWLLDGALQFQSFMYTQGFVGVLTGGAAGQPHWLASSIMSSAEAFGDNLALWNTLSALTQVIIGLGLLYRPTVKGALVVSFAWCFIVWGLAESFGLLFSNTASPLTGAPGAVLLYALIGALVSPTERPGGLLGLRGARTTWAAVWVVMAWLWLLAANSTANATSSAIDAAPSGMAWLTSLQHSVANAAAGHGLPIAIVLAGLSAAVGVAVAINWHPRAFLALAVILNVAYWVLGQGLGGIFTGSGTDPNAGPVFILFAVAMYALLPAPEPEIASRTTV
jgi:hypothetical protein